MKTRFVPLFFVGALFASCGEQVASQKKKQFIDELLAGKEVPMNSLETYRSTRTRNEYYRNPVNSAIPLGYSEEDLKKLRRVVVRISEEKPEPEK